MLSFGAAAAAASAEPQQSPSWSGYALPSSTTPFTQVSGQWSVPTLDCARTPLGAISTWVGIGGEAWSGGGSSGPLLQTGVSSRCRDGRQLDLGWWEEYPSAPNQARVFGGFPLAPGSALRASVVRLSSGQWETRLEDLASGLTGVMVTGEGWGVTPGEGGEAFPSQGRTVGLGYSGGYSAEWIAEDYLLNGVPVPFADYGSVTFSNLETSRASWSLAAADGLELVRDGTVLSAPSAPTADGFTLSYGG